MVGRTSVRSTSGPGVGGGNRRGLEPCDDHESVAAADIIEAACGRGGSGSVGGGDATVADLAAGCLGVGAVAVVRATARAVGAITAAPVFWVVPVVEPVTRRGMV